MEIISSTTDEKTGGHSHLVTALKPAVRNEHRVNVFIDDEYSFSLDLAQVVDTKIKVGQRLDEAKLAEYKNLSELGKLYQSTLEWVLMRPRSERELSDYLKRKKLRRSAENRRRSSRRKYLKEHPEKRQEREALKELPELDEQNISKVITMLLERGYIDDEKFAEYYVENRMVKKGISQRRMRQELFKKGISTPVIEQVLSQSSRNDVEEIKKVIQKKRARYSDEKLIQYLTRQGFDFQTVKSLVLEMD